MGADGKRFVSSLLVTLIEEVRGLRAEIVLLRRDLNGAVKVAPAQPEKPDKK